MLIYCDNCAALTPRALLRGSFGSLASLDTDLVSAWLSVVSCAVTHSDRSWPALAEPSRV